eukprot:scaffold4766_cov390-Prasinococcus_capsulatus_cf.AAC.2
MVMMETMGFQGWPGANRPGGADQYMAAPRARYPPHGCLARGVLPVAWPAGRALPCGVAC